MKSTPQKIMLIVNPVSGRMKSTSGLCEILDELYRDDPAEDILPLTEGDAQAAYAPPRDTVDSDERPVLRAVAKPVGKTPARVGAMAIRP